MKFRWFPVPPRGIFGMLIGTLLFVGMLLSGSLLSAEDKTVELDPARTTVNFTLGDVLHTVHGSFKLKKGTIRFDLATGKATGEIVVDVASGASGNGARDRRMHNEILESARYPEAAFVPDHVTGQFVIPGMSEIDAQGVFQIHGASHPMTLHFKIQGMGAEITAATSFTIPYVQWGIKNPSNFFLRVDDKVEVTVQASGRMSP